MVVRTIVGGGMRGFSEKMRISEEKRKEDVADVGQKKQTASPASLSRALTLSLLFSSLLESASPTIVARRAKNTFLT